MENEDKCVCLENGAENGGYIITSNVYMTGGSYEQNLFCMESMKEEVDTLRQRAFVLNIEDCLKIKQGPRQEYLCALVRRVCWINDGL